MACLCVVLGERLHSAETVPDIQIHNVDKHSEAMEYLQASLKGEMKYEITDWLIITQFTSGNKKVRK